MGTARVSGSRPSVGAENPSSCPPILATKLHRPPVPAGAVLRAALLDRLELGRSRRFTLISAPPGYGKTTLAAQWLDRSPLPAAWLSLDSGDNYPERFLRYLVAAVRTAVLGFGSELERLLSALRLPPPGDLADMTVAEFARLDGPLQLVLDDCQTVTDPAVHQMVVRILEHMPTGVHPVFLTRSDPPWPLAKWRATEQLSEFRAADLGFTEPEAVSFFAGGGLSPRPRQCSSSGCRGRYRASRTGRGPTNFCSLARKQSKAPAGVSDGGEGQLT